MKRRGTGGENKLREQGDVVRGTAAYLQEALCVWRAGTGQSAHRVPPRCRGPMSSLKIM